MKKIFLFILLGLLLFGIASYRSVKATFPGTNGKIAFASDRDGDLEVYTMNPDGTGLTQLTSNAGADDRAPAWSPDATKIVYQSSEDGDAEIFTMNPDGSGKTQLTFNSAFDGQPAWSPDALKIVFESTRDGDYEIYLMNADGSGVTQLTNNSSDDFAAEWSPDGSKITFTGDRDDPSYEIYTMNPDGSGQTRLTFDSTQDVISRWSPDGAKILWRKDFGGCSGMDLWVMNADGTSQTQLVCAPSSDGEGAFSPDGTKVVFTSTRFGNNEFFVRDVTGAEGSEIRITSNTYSEADVDWGRAPYLAVSIDTKPGSYPNCFNNDGNGVIPVAVFGSATFDVTQVDPGTVKLEGLTVKAAGKSDKLLSHLEDVNGDGYMDLVVQIDDTDNVFSSGTGTAVLTGNLYSEFGGTVFSGSDSICVTQ